MVAYLRPNTLDEALAVRAAHDVEIIAGGTDVYPNKTTRAGWGRMGHKAVLDITGIAGLDRIEAAEKAYRLGCRVTWSDVIAADLPPLFDGLKAAAREIGGAQIQNRGTVVGNLCTASPAGDGIPVLFAMGAQVEVAGPETRRLVPVEHFIDAYRHVALHKGEIVIGLVVPTRGPSARSGFLKLGARRYLVISIAIVAGVIETDADGLIADARLVVGACSAVAQRLFRLEDRLKGQSMGEHLPRLVEPGDFGELAPLDDIRASAAYRLAVAEALTRDLLGALADAERQQAA